MERPNGLVPVVVNVINGWATGPFDCLKDEETCWWGTWCCCLLSGRTAQTFEVGSSKWQVWGFMSLIFVAFILNLILPGIGLIILLCGVVGYAVYRARIRTKIRDQNGISGTGSSDIVLHVCCPCCAVCQEAREAKVRDMKKIDFCYGEELSSLYFPQESPAGVSAALSAEAELPGIMEELNHISQLSQLLMRISVALAVLAFVVLITSDHAENFAVLLLVFVQPVIIMYVVYWRKLRKHASVDYIIKLFAAGFFLATTQSIVLESFLEGVIGILVSIGVNVLGIEPDEDGMVADPGLKGRVSLQSELVNAVMRAMGYDSHGQHLTNSGTGISSAFSVPSISSLVLKATTVSTINSLEDGDGEEGDSGSGSEDDYNGYVDSGYSPEEMRKYFPLIVLVLFLMAFVVAAGVEETMKHFTVRCCRFPAPLKDPYAVMIYLMTGALGFATSENIEYVFGTSSSPIPGTSLFVGELFVLLIRVLMPIHLICSVLQATNLSKVSFLTSAEFIKGALSPS